MSKLSIHISANPEGLDPLLLKCAQANSPISVIYSVDQNIADSIKRNSPGTKWIYRRQARSFERLPDAWNGDPEQNARNWLIGIRDPADQHRTQVENWALNHADWYDPLNEPAIEIADPNNPEQVAEAVRRAKWLNTWLLTALNIAKERDVRLALCSFPTESPPVDARIWNELIPALRLGKQLGAILSLHAYGDPFGDGSLSGKLSERPQAYLRHRDIWALLPEDARLDVVYSECGADNGFNTGSVSKSDTRFIDDLAACDLEWMKDRGVLAACAFQVGKGVESEIKPDVLEKYGDYVSTHPTPNEPPHIAPPQEASAEGTMVPPNIKITDSAGHVWSLGEQAVHGRVLLRDGMQFADGQGVLLLFHDQKVFTQNDQNQWFVATTEWQPIPGNPRLEPLTPAPQKERKILNVPYLSQLAPSANFAPGDCGPSDVAMLLSFHGVTLTVNDVSQATGQPKGFTSLSIFDLSDVAAKFGLTLRREVNFSIAELRQQIDTGKPCIVLVNYPLLPHRFDPNHTRAHFLVVVGHTNDGLIYHDPFFRDDDGKAIEIIDADFDRAWSTLPDSQNFTIPRQALLDVTFMPSDTELSANQDATVPHPTSPIVAPSLSSTASPQPTPALRGLQMRADGNSNPTDFECITIAKLDAAKIMTNTSFEEYAHLRLSSKVQPDRIVLRLFAAGDNPSLGNAEQFFREQFAWLKEFNDHGGRYVEMHNEPNLAEEGLGLWWADAASFAGWFTTVAQRLRAEFPQLQIGYPGLSPSGGVLQPRGEVTEWLPTIRGLVAGNLIDWIGVHCYWQSIEQMNHADHGRFYERFLNFDRPVIVTEFSNNSVEVSPEKKGAQYKAYYASLPSNVLGAFAFVSSASEPVFNARGETWVRADGTVTAIPHVVQ